MNAKHELEQIFFKASQNKMALEYIEEIDLLLKRYIDTDDFDNLNYSARSFISFIYAYNELHEESFAISLELLPNKTKTSLQYLSVLSWAVKSSAELGRTDEVLPFAVAFLKNDTVDFGKLFIFDWYIDHFPHGENGSFKAFEPILDQIAKALDIKIDVSLSFAEQVKYLRKEHHDGSRRLHSLQLGLKKATAKQKHEKIEHYMSIETVGWYKNYVLENCEKW